MYAESNSAMPIADKNRKFNLQGALVLAAIIGPMIAAYLVFKTGIGVGGETINHGQLLTPATSILPLQTINSEGKSEPIITEEKRWRMLVVADDSCTKICRDRLYLARQVHIRLADKATRVERLFISSGGAATAEFKNWLETEHPGLRYLSVDSSQWETLFANSSIESHGVDGSHIYLVDQEGFAMMSYDTTETGNGMLSDIKRLLRYSYE